MRKLERIALVEDEADIREITQIALEEIGGFALNVCESGSEALEKMQGFRPDLVLLDMMMPGMDGIETLRSLRAIPDMDKVPIVFLTARAQKHEVEQYQMIGAAGVISKPFDPITLPDYIRSIWEQSRPRR
jgi:CheY-like chemotaxis protein